MEKGERKHNIVCVCPGHDIHHFGAVRLRVPATASPPPPPRRRRTTTSHLYFFELLLLLLGGGGRKKKKEDGRLARTTLSLTGLPLLDVWARAEEEEEAVKVRDFSLEEINIFPYPLLVCVCVRGGPL